jgi:hypothetical protein
LSLTGWITIFKTKSREGQIKIVARGPADCAVSYVTVWLANPQLLHCRMISYCEAQVRGGQGHNPWREKARIGLLSFVFQTNRLVIFCISRIFSFSTARLISYCEG